MPQAEVGFLSLHHESLPEVVRAVRERAVDAVLLSVRQCRGTSLDQLDHLTRDFPEVPTVALVSQPDPLGSEILLQLGASGVRQVVDVSTPAGWQRLRQILGQPASRDAARLQAPILAALGEVPPDTRLFFEALVRFSPEVVTARDLADRLQVRCTTLMSRFSRAGLPSPKSYLAAVPTASRQPACSSDAGSPWRTWPIAWSSAPRRVSAGMSDPCWG